MRSWSAGGGREVPVSFCGNFQEERSNPANPRKNAWSGNAGKNLELILRSRTFSNRWHIHIRKGKLNFYSLEHRWPMESPLHLSITASNGSRQTCLESTNSVRPMSSLSRNFQKAHSTDHVMCSIQNLPTLHPQITDESSYLSGYCRFFLFLSYWLFILRNPEG